MVRGPYPLKGWDLWEHKEAVKRSDAARARLAAMTPNERMGALYGGYGAKKTKRKQFHPPQPWLEEGRYTPAEPHQALRHPLGRPTPSHWVLDGWWCEDGGYCNEVLP